MVDSALRANTAGSTAYWTLKIVKAQTKPKPHPKPFEIHDIQT